MRAADTDELQERIEHALWGFTQVYDAEDGRGTEIGVHAPVHKVVSAVLPIVSGEVRKAKAEAWDEATRIALNFAYLNQEDRITLYLRPPHDRNPYRTTETGDQT